MRMIFILIFFTATGLNFSNLLYSFATGEIKSFDLLYEYWEYANVFGKMLLILGFIFLIPSTIIFLVFKWAFLLIKYIIGLGFSTKTALERHIYSVDLPEPIILDYLRKQKIDFIIGKDRLFLPSKKIQKEIVKLSLEKNLEQKDLK